MYRYSLTDQPRRPAHPCNVGRIVLDLLLDEPQPRYLPLQRVRVVERPVDLGAGGTHLRRDAQHFQAKRL